MASPNKPPVEEPGETVPMGDPNATPPGRPDAPVEPPPTTPPQQPGAPVEEPSPEREHRP